MKAAILEIIASFAYGVIVSSFAASGLISESVRWLFALINAVLIAGLVLAMPRWGIWFTIGWVVAVAILANSGLLEPIDYLVYLGGPAAIWGFRIWRWLSGG
jgi:hypothetical protein